MTYRQNIESQGDTVCAIRALGGAVGPVITQSHKRDRIVLSSAC